MVHKDAVISAPETIEYGFICSFDGNGGIFNRDNKMLWKFKTVYSDSRHKFPYSFLKLLPDFILYDDTGQEILTIICTQRYPLPQFVMRNGKLSFCTVQQIGVLPKSYLIDFKNGNKLNFYIPLFTVFYQGIFENGAKVLVRKIRHDTWHIQIPANQDNFRLLAVLAFIHREQQR